MTPYQGEHDPAYQYDIHDLANRPSEAVEELLAQGRITLGTFIAAAAIREAKVAPVSSQFQDEAIFRARAREEKKLSAPNSPGDFVMAAVEACETEGVLKKGNRS